MGLAVELVGIEGDAGHVGFAHEALAANHFSPAQVTLRWGVAAAAAGVALFPRQDVAGASWGLEPVFGATDAQRHDALRLGSHDEVPMVPLTEMLAPYRRVDLLHADIQGGEAELVEACLPVLGEKVAFLVIGTHSRQIEGRLLAGLLRAGWLLEIERPCIMTLGGEAPSTAVDGVQGWRNPHLLPQGDVSP